MMANCRGRIQDGIYNCFGKWDDSICYECIYNPEADPKDAQDHFCSSCEKVTELYQFLRGKERPEDVYCKMPKLSANMAFTVIWFLQEYMHVLPDSIQQCRGCKRLFDSDSEGSYIDSDYTNTQTGKPVSKKYWGDWCEDCISAIEHKL